MATLKLKTSGSSLDNISLPGKLAVGLLLVLMVGAAYFVLFYGDVESQIGSQESALEAKQSELQQLEQSRAVYLKDVEEKTRREALVKKQKKILPDEQESAAFLLTVQTVATISGVQLASWTPLDEQPADFYAKVPMQLKLEGRFHQVAKFFHGVGQVDRIINVEDITIKAVPPKDDKKATESELQKPVEVQVECLATAFRALRTGETAEGSGKDKRGRKVAPKKSGAEK
jgi:type IV pilus assembly protein PilO